jgi:hypothetical protein
VSDGPRNNAQTTRGRPFQRGNPGRQHGARHKVTQAVEQLLAGEHEALSKKVIELALKGDTVALRLCLDRIAPPRRDAPISIALPSITHAAGLVEAGGAVAAALAAGDLTPEEAGRTMAVLQAQRQILETVDLAQRIAALEAGRSDEDSAPVAAWHVPIASGAIAAPSEPAASDAPQPTARRLTLRDTLSAAESELMRLVSLIEPVAPGEVCHGTVPDSLAPLEILEQLAERGLLDPMPVREGIRRVIWTEVGAKWRRAMA